MSEYSELDWETWLVDSGPTELEIEKAALDQLKSVVNAELASVRELLKRLRKDGHLGSKYNDPLFHKFSAGLVDLEEKVDNVLKETGTKKPAGFFNALMSFILPEGKDEIQKHRRRLEQLLGQVQDHKITVDTVSQGRCRMISADLVTTGYGEIDDSIHGSGLCRLKPEGSLTQLKYNEHIPKPDPTRFRRFRRVTLLNEAENFGTIKSETIQESDFDPESVPREVARLARRLIEIRTSFEEITDTYKHRVVVEISIMEARNVILAMASHTYLQQQDVDSMYDQIDHLFCYLFILDCHVTTAKDRQLQALELDFLGTQADKLSEKIIYCVKRFKEFVAMMKARDNYLFGGNLAARDPTSESGQITGTEIGVPQISRVSGSPESDPLETIKDYTHFVEDTLSGANWPTDENVVLQEHEKSVMAEVAKAVGNKDFAHDAAVDCLSNRLRLRHIPVYQGEISTENLLGVGAFGDVLTSTRTNTQEKVAIKIVRLKNETKVAFPRRLLLHEAWIWCGLENQNILPLMGYTEILVDNELVIGLVSAECVMGNLWDHKRRGHANDFKKQVKLLRGVANGLRYLHSQHHCVIIHGDLRAVNILVDDKGNCRLCDFGLSTVIESDTQVLHATDITDVHWLAPELVGHGSGAKAAEMVNPTTDMYAFGCVAHEVFLSRFPYIGLEEEYIVNRKKAGKFPERPCEQLLPTDDEGNRKWSFMEKHWNNVPSSRPSAEDSYKELDKWFKELDS
ncbi:kinase-like protein [Rickenella mellea]|uniref:Kinase-like protein n=1 Tax=Rickenella mellea TaxID=50990 RepID=A0A4Y7Q388_9AGAM|nr:kinase-like protein [Rickenella mellea]